MPTDQSCNHLYCKLKLHYRRYLKLPLLLALAVIVLLCVLGVRMLGGFSDTNETKDVALKFAQEVKRVENETRERHIVLSLMLNLSESGKTWAYKVYDQGQVLRSQTLPDGMSGNGEISFGPDGTPLSPAMFVFQKGNHKVGVVIDSMGQVSFPETIQETQK